MKWARLENNVKKVMQELSGKTEAGLNEVGQAWLTNCTIQVTNMKVVDTGRLRASLSFLTPRGSGGNIPVANSESNDKLKGSSKRNQVIVGSNVPYAKINETGGAKRRARPFLEKSIIGHENQYKEIFIKTLKGEL